MSYNFVILRRNNFSVSCANLIRPPGETLSRVSSLGNPERHKIVTLKQEGSLCDSLCRSRNLEIIYLEQDCDINFTDMVKFIFDRRKTDRS